jgi:hypothetical protein
MPRYFIDTSDGDLTVVDREGLELLNDNAAREAALGTLPDMARDLIPDGDRRSFTVSVRNISGNTIYSAVLTLEGSWR